MSEQGGEELSVVRLVFFNVCILSIFRLRFCYLPKADTPVMFRRRKANAGNPTS